MNEDEGVAAYDEEASRIKWDEKCAMGDMQNENEAKLKAKRKSKQKVMRQSGRSTADLSRRCECEGEKAK